jgi:predicted DNA-binding transcriptional regulator AlpA
MHSKRSGKARAGRPKKARTTGTRCVWPSGVQEQFGISEVTRWRWERDGLLPARDVFVGGKAVGWRPETLEAAARNSRPAA